MTAPAAPEPYHVYLMDLSYFSGKLEAYLRWKEIPYERVEVGWREMQRVLLPNTGLMKVPTVRTPEGLWLQDSTPIIDWMEERHPAGAVVPEDPFQAFFVRLAEDHADEWMWRPALHYRWSFAPDARLLGERIADEVMKDVPIPRRLRAAFVRRRQRQVYVRGDGVTAETRPHVEAAYRRAIAQLTAILRGGRYLLGDRPSLADFGFFASMFRHFALDPTPSRIMRDEAPDVLAWVARLWSARASLEKGDPPPAGTLPQGWETLLREIGETHLPYLHANAVAWREGRRRFDWTVQGVTYRATPVVRYRVWCRERLQDHFQALPPSVKPAVRSVLQETGAWEPLWAGGIVRSRLHEGAKPPVCRPAQGRPSLRALRDGTPWNAD